MKNITKKIIIYSLLGMMQSGVGVSVIQASALYREPIPMQQQEDQDEHDQERREAERIENERYEHAMERRPNESEREWNERQNRENDRHQRNLKRINHAIFTSKSL